MRSLNNRFNTMHSDLINASEKDDCSASVFLELSKYPASSADHYLRKGLSNPRLSPNTLRELFNSGNKKIIGIILTSSNLPEDIISRVISSNNLKMIIDLSKNKNLDFLSTNKLLKYSLENEIKLPDVIVNLIENKKISLLYCIKNQEKLNVAFKNYSSSLDSVICNYIMQADSNSLDEIYPECKKNDYLLSIIKNKNASSKLLESICFNNGNELVYIELSKNSKITQKTKEYLLTLNNPNIYINLCENGICDIDDNISIIRKYHNNSLILDACLKSMSDYLEKNKEKLYPSQINALLKYDNKKIILFLANNADSLYVEYQIELIKQGDEEVFKALSEKSNHVFILRLISLVTKNLDTFANCAISLKDSPEDMTIIQWLDNYKNLLLSKHPKAKEVTDAINRWGTIKDKLFKHTSTNNRMIFNYYTSLMNNNLWGTKEKRKTNTSLIQKNDEIYLNDQDKIEIKPDNFDVILHNLELNNEREVVYGEYPTKEMPQIICCVLDFLYKFKLLDKTGKRYRMIGSDGRIFNLQEYIFNDRKFVKLNNNNPAWIEVNPIIWKVNKEERSLEMKEIVLNLDLSLSSKFLTSFFKSDVFEEYKITKEELDYKNELAEKRKNPKFKTIKSKEKENELNSEIDKIYKELSSQLLEVKKTLEFLETHKMVKNDLLKGLLWSTSVPEEELIVEVDGHREFNKDYIDSLKFIDLSLLDVTNLKLSNLDLRDTNIRINPQIIFNKDLSNSKLSDSNVVWASFKDVDLRGADISDEKESYDIEYAIIDESTKLPINYVESKKLD